MKRWAWGVAGAAILVAVIGLVLLGRHQLDRFESLALSAKTHAASGVLSLRGKQADAALTSFSSARDEFGQARDLLGPRWLRVLPWLGHQLEVADDLATIGYEGSSAGAEVSALLGKAHAVQGEDRLGQLLVVARPHVDSALASLVNVADRADGLSTEGLVPELSGAVSEVQALLEPLQLVLDRSHALLELERYLFSAQHRFLVVSQNSAELRPTGGFMGTFGLVEFGPEGFNLQKYADIYTLPKDTLNLPLPEGGQVNYKHFYFRNTNWWMDFPTSTGVMMTFWQNLGQPHIDGIVAIDIPTIRDLLKVFGPITVPESDVPLTADNVMEQLTYVVEYKHGQAGAAKKNAVVSLAAELLRRVTHLTPDQFSPTLRALATSATEKHVQVYFTDPPAQAAVVAAGWSGAIAPPAGTTDLLAVSNGVIKPSKANFGVSKSLDYRVQLRADGSAETTLELGYRKNRVKLKGVPQHWLANYVRAHRGDGTTLGGQEPGSEFQQLQDATGLPTFGHYFRLDLGGSTTVVMRSQVPRALQDGSASAAQPTSGTAADGSTSHYRLLVAKQADLVDTSASVTITVPDGWRATGARAWFRNSGTPVATTANDGTLSVQASLKEDLLVDVDLVRA